MVILMNGNRAPEWHSIAFGKVGATTTEIWPVRSGAP